MRCLALLPLLPGLCAGADAYVDFGRKVRGWDGFGVNYVETRHTRDYREFPQDYGGFKYLTGPERELVIELIFGRDGLKPAIVKVFCDPFHEPVNDNADPYLIRPAAFDHTSTTQWIRYFARRGLERTHSWGGDLTFIAGLYGPPAWTTRQKTLRGRDLDPAMKLELAEYIGSWVRYLGDVEKLPVRYISMFNESEDPKRWPEDGGDWPSHYAQDYNLWWPPEQVADFLKYARGVLDRLGLKQVGLASGETATWESFHKLGYAQAIRSDAAALRNLALITSHGFARQFDPAGIDLLRQAKPGLHAWTTSYTWGDMDLEIVEDARGLIYGAGCNALIPWAVAHHDYESDKLSPPAGMRVSSNANSPIKTNGGHVVLTKAYYLYKQVSRAGQPGMAVAEVGSDNPEIALIAFAGNRTRNPDALVVINKSREPRPVKIAVRNSPARAFEAYVTDEARLDYAPAGEFEYAGGTLSYTAPARSATTFFAGPKPALAVVEKIAGEAGFYTADGKRLTGVKLGKHPHEIVLSPDKRFLYVSDNGILWMTEPGEGGNTISIIDRAAMKKVGVIDLGKYRRPHGMDIDPKTGRMIVTIENPDGLLLIDPVARKVLRQYDVRGADPHMALFGPAGRWAYVSNTASSNIAAVHLQTGRVKLIPTDARPQGGVVARDRKLIYFTNSDGNSISIIDPLKNERAGTIQTGRGPGRIAMTLDGRTLVYNLQPGAAVGFADVASGKEVAQVPLGGEPLSLTMSADGRTVYAGVQAQDKVFVISVAERRIVRVIETPKGSGPDPALPLPE